MEKKDLYLEEKITCLCKWIDWAYTKIEFQLFDFGQINKHNTSHQNNTTIVTERKQQQNIIAKVQSSNNFISLIFLHLE